MLIFDHHRTEIVLLPLLILAAAVWCFRRVEVRRSLLRIPVRTVAVLVIALVAIELLMDGCAEAWNVTTASEPVYSPDHKHALVVRTVDAGALGGFTYVDVYSYGGLLEQGLAGGEWKAIEQQNIRWTSNHDVEMHFDRSYPAPPECESTSAVRVICLPLP